MKKLYRLIIVSLAFSLTGTAFAHSDHGTINEKSAIQVAKTSVQKMTFQDLGFPIGKLDSSWKSVRSDDVKITNFSSGVYEVMVVNANSEQPLYLKISETGELLQVSTEAF